MQSGRLRGAAKYLAACRSFTRDRTVWRERFHKNPFAFVRRSLRAEADVLRLTPRPDLALQIHGMFCPAWNKSKLPYVMYLDYTMALAEREWPAWAPFAHRRDRDGWLSCERRAYHNAAHLFAMSELVRQSLIEDYGLPADKVTAVGASGDFAAPARATAERQRNTLLFISSNFERKGGDLLFAAFVSLRKAQPDLRLWVLGSAIPAAPEGVEHLGYLSDEREMARLFGAADLLVMPSRCDPFPLSLIEAMNHGVPSVVTQVSGMPEIVRHGVTGLVVEKDSSEQLAAAIGQLLQDAECWRRMSEAGRREVEGRLNWDSVARRMAEVMASL